MKVLLLSNPDSSHTIKWVNGLASKGVEIYLLSLNPLDESQVIDSQLIHYSNLGFSKKSVSRKPGSLNKIGYLRILPEIKKAIRYFEPDIVHAHYASSYGVLGACSAFHPFVLSVWGSDVYRFPGKSFLHRWLMQFSLRKADWILSTSNAMVRSINKYTNKNIEVTPFGIDTDVFKIDNSSEDSTDDSTIVIGTVKHLKKIYGIDILIKAFKIVVERNKTKTVKLLIAGDGPDRNRLEQLVDKLGISEKVEFTGYVSPVNIPFHLNRMNIFAALSIIDESFGVSVLEAGACGLPVVGSDVPGFREIIKDHETGYVIPRNNFDAAADVIDALVNDRITSEQMGIQARKHVEKNYSLASSLDKMMKIYSEAIKEG
ncbi:MAG: glycosyltransferase [Bacteroidales bacterium]